MLTFRSSRLIRRARNTHGMATVTLAVVVAAAIGVALIAVFVPRTTTTKVNAMVREYSVRIDRTTAPDGKLRVAVHNSGRVMHELVVFRTDLAESDLPVTNTGRLNENGVGVKHISPEAEDIKVGTSKTITLDLAKGRYVFACNLDDHYSRGMHTVMNVT